MFAHVVGQALVIFKTREAAKKVVRKLDEGCLLLSNGRYVVRCFPMHEISVIWSQHILHLFSLCSLLHSDNI